MKPSNPGKRAADRMTFSEEGVLAALRDTVTALRAETVPAPAHRRPRELASCWNAVFRDIEKLEAAFLSQHKLVRALADAPHDLTAAKRVPSLQRKAEQLRVEVLGTVSLPGAIGQGRARSRRSRQSD